MSDQLREWLGWIAVAAGVAVITHVAAVDMTPHAIMSGLFSHMGAPNRIYHDARVDARVHGVVRPSPDLLYSACPFDLSAGPLRVRSPVPNGTYWSVALYDDNTNNFYTLDDHKAGGGSVVDFLIVPGNDEDRPDRIEGMKVVPSPTTKGLVLFRTLIDSEKDFALLDATRREASCATFNPSVRDVSGTKG